MTRTTLKEMNDTTMMEWVLASVFVVAFIGFIKQFSVVPTGKAVLRNARTILYILRDRTISDDDKEASLRSFVLPLLKQSAAIFFGGAAALGIPYCVLYLLELLHATSIAAIFEIMLSPLFIFATTIIGALFSRSKYRANQAP